MQISLIITTYNRPKALIKVLESVQDQSRLPDEIIVADDGSGQETKHLIDGFISQSYFKLHHVWHEDRGFRAAKIRNEAIKASIGHYIILLDGDCIPSKTFIKDHLFLAENGFFIQGKRVLTSKKLVNMFISSKGYTSPFQLFPYIISGDITNSYHLIRFPIFPAIKSKGMSGIKSCNMGIFKRDIIAVNGFNEDFIGWGREDSELAIRLYRYGLRRKAHPFRAICFHLWHRENDKTRLAANNKLLKKAMESNEFFCNNGLVKK